MFGTQRILEKRYHFPKKYESSRLLPSGGQGQLGEVTIEC